MDGNLYKIRVDYIRPPWNFSWVVENQLAAMACPHSLDNLKYLLRSEINHLISLSAETLPPLENRPILQWTIIPVEEFEAPSLDDIIKFIDICNASLSKNETVGVHCRQGRGRTGTMAACFLIKFQDLTPNTAILNIRLQRPGSIETYRQEKAIFKYYDYLRGTKT